MARPRPRQVFAWLAAAAAAWPVAAQQRAPAAAPASGTPAAAGASLHLLDALGMALRRNPEILAGEAQVTAEEGALQTARGSFDPVARGSFDARDSGVDDTRTHTASVGVEQRLRNGLVLEGRVQGGASRLPPAGTPAVARTVTSLSVVVPLMRGRDREVIAADEDIRRLELEASRHDQRERAGKAILDVTRAYWQLRAAGQRLTILQDAEARAARQVRDTQRLIAADEQPAASIHLVTATLNERIGSRLDGERVLVQARLELKRLIGLNPAAAGFDNAADAFPTETGPPIGLEDQQSLIDDGLRQRAALHAARLKLRARRLAMAAAADGLKPVLNGTVRLGLGGSTSGAIGLEPLWQGRAGRHEVFAGLDYRWPWPGNEAKGRFLTASAGYDQQSIQARALEHSVAAAISSAVAAYNASLARLERSRQTVDLFQRAVDGERGRLRLGTATLLDVVNVEASLQQARTAHVDTLSDHVAAIATLRFETGSMVRGVGAMQLIATEKLLRWRAGEPADPWFPSEVDP